MGLQGKTRRSAVNHVAIDLGSKESQVCVRDASGMITFEKKHSTHKLGTLMKTWPVSRVVLETSSEAFLIADQARAAGHEVRVVPSTLAIQLGVGERGVKNDVRDARKLSEVSTRIDLPSVHVPSEMARYWRSLLKSRETLIETRTKTISHVRGWLRTQLWKIGSGATETFPNRVRHYATNQNSPLPSHIEDALALIELMNTQAKASMNRIRELAKGNSVCRRLMTTPGIGPVTALAFVAVVDDISRFRHAYQLTSYLGVTPGEDSSSERSRRTSITKAGPTSMRRLLVQAAWAVFRYRLYDPKRLQVHPLLRWATQIAERRGKCIAAVALARKLATVMYALWRDQTEYSPLRAAAPA
jgi:transposase